MTSLEEFQVPGHGGNVHVRLWAPSSTPRALVFIVHGYAEHGGRYGHVAEALTASGLAVVAPDHVGHGLSDGERALITDFGLAVDDLDAVALATFKRLNASVPLLLVGHSMGGLLAARFVQRWPNRTAGAAFLGAVIGDWKWAREVLSSPGSTTHELAPMDPHGMSRNPQVADSYAQDPLIYRGMNKRELLEAEVVALDEYRSEVDRLRLPVGFFHGTADPFVPYMDSLQAINDMPSTVKTIKIYDGARHELLNETNKQEVIADLQTWIDSTLAAQPEVSQ